MINGMHRTTVTVEITAYEQARAALGTRGYTDTINGALREIVRQRTLQRAAELVRGGNLSLVTPAELLTLRKPRN
jgi:hypothetical protein